MISTPSPPDPREVAAAQGGSSREASIASGVLNNANERTPFGNLTYKQTGQYRGRDAQGNPYTVPRYTRTVSLSDAERRKLSQTQNLQQSMLKTAGRQMDRISGTLSKPIDTGRLPERQSTVGTPRLNDEASMYGAPARQGSVNLQRDANMQGAPARRGSVRMVDDVNMYGAPERRNRVNLQNEISMHGAPSRQNTIGLDRAATTYDSGGRVRNVDLGQNFQRSYTPEGGFSEDRQRVEDAIMSRLEPRFEQDRAALENQLLNQGFTRGSEAFNRELERMGQDVNDARMQAVLAGGQEQSRLLGEARMAGQFSNDALGMRNQSLLDERGFNNAAQGQRDDQSYRRAVFGNQAVGQNNQATMAEADFRNAARDAHLNEQLARGEFGNRATLAEGEFQNQARRDALNEGVTRGEFTNQARLAGAGFQNQARNDALNESLARGEFGNRAALAEGTFQNAARDSALNESLARTGFTNAARQQGFQNRMGAADFGNNQRTAALQELLALRNQPLNELTAALSGSQVSLPQFQGQYRQGVQPPPVGDYIYDSYANEAANARAGMSGLFGLGSSLLGGLFSLSDVRAKEDIEPVGQTHGGTPLYKYRYKGDPETHIGPMAQEVAQRQPEAVGLFADGLLGVDYRKVH